MEEKKKQGQLAEEKERQELEMDKLDQISGGSIGNAVKEDTQDISQNVGERV